MKRSVLVLASMAILLFVVRPASATPVTYTESAIATGSLDGTSFLNALVTITLNGNTSALVTPSPGLFEIFGAATVTVSGIGTDTFTDSMDVFDNNPLDAAGITDSSINADVLDTVDPAFGTYGLTTAIGPITNTSLINSGFDFLTTGGFFDITSVFEDTSTFTATTTSTTPEPGSLVLLGLGFAGLLGMRKLGV
jgi:hypothetical protein